MNARLLLICTALLLFANGSRADDGRYQLAKDGKTFVWNNRPRPNDAASWSGKRDEDGYATGYGTLTWYLSEKKIVTGSNLPTTKHVATSSYSGKMVDGKFEGLVANVDANGRTFHGTFVDGHKTRDWARGPISRRDRTDIAADRQREENVRHAELVDTAEAGPAAPAQGPSSIVETPTSDVQRPTPNSESIREQGAQPPMVEAPAEGPPNVQKSDVSQKSEISGRATAKKPSAGMNDSLRSLIAPPASLRVNLPDEPPSSEATASQAATPQASAPRPAASVHVVASLTGPEVVALADAEASRQGYNVRDFQRSGVDYTAADETWAVSYDQTDAAGAGKHFSVRVEDKTKKAEIRK